MKNLSKLLLIFSTVAIISCGDKEEKETITLEDQETTQSTTQSTPATSTTGTEVDSNAEVIEITLTADDQMRFGTNEIKVSPGQTVRLTLVHTGEMAKNVMGHNFVLLTQGTDINTFGQQAVQAADNDYIPRNTNQVIAHTKLIGGGESTTIEFQAPEAGTYDFICSFPGHYAVMRGKFIVG